MVKSAVTRTGTRSFSWGEERGGEGRSSRCDIVGEERFLLVSRSLRELGARMEMNEPWTGDSFVRMRCEKMEKDISMDLSDFDAQKSVDFDSTE